MNILVCVKRVPMVGGRISLLPEGLQIDTRQLGFTISPHEECAVEEAVRLVERYGGTVTVLALGPPEAEEQLRNAVAVGAGSAVLLVTDRTDWGPMATAEAIVEAVRRRDEGGGGDSYDLLLFGNEAADSGDFQVGVRVVAPARPAVRHGHQVARRGGRGRRASRRRPGGSTGA